LQSPAVLLIDNSKLSELYYCSCLTLYIDSPSHIATGNVMLLMSSFHHQAQQAKKKKLLGS